MGGGAFHPRRKRQAGGGEQGRACTQGQGHRAWWPEARLGKGRGRIHASGTALVLLLAGDGAGDQTQFYPLSSLLHPEHV